MFEGQKLGDALRVAIARKGVTQQDVAAFFGVKQSSVSEWCSTGRIAKKHINGLVEYFRDVVGADHWGLQPAYDVAQTMSYHSSDNAQHDGTKRVAWGRMKQEDLPEVFWAEVPDNAMADRIIRGDLVKFDRRLKPEPEEMVLVTDTQGNWYLRTLVPGLAGRFTAVPRNRDYKPMDSHTGETRELTILAVYVTHRAPERKAR